ncbi:MAG: preprotein translocase subunit SecE [Gammaproteobacteria bacterium]|nr:MAG: preprotein translocase subunit SecE [Gammaproteobacteria bacterium]
MNAKAEARSTRLDSLKLMAAALVVAVTLVGFYYYGHLPLFLRVLGLLVGAGIGAAIALQTQKGRDAWRFVLEARDEVRKVVWPTRQETIQTTLIVFATVLIVATFLWLIDLILLWAVRVLTGQGG